MATKSGQDTASTEQVEELLDAVDMTLDRLKTLYEQYFLGIQKQAPAFIHNDVERKLRDLTQINIRNTGLRYRLATLQQKFGSYNSYWRRTLRQIENGTYARNLAKIGREAARTGSDIPDEILAAMPKRMREQVLRDRDQALAIAKRRNQVDEGAVAADPAFAPDETVQLDDEALLAQAAPKREAKTRSGAHVLSEDDADIDFNALFSAFEDDAPKVIERARRESARLGAMSQASSPPAGSPAGAPSGAGASAGAPRPGTSSQTMTQPLPRPQMPRMPVPTTATPPAGSAAPGTPPPGSTTAIPRPMTQTPSAPIQATGPIPVMAPPATQTSAIPRPVGQQASGPTQAIPRPPGVHQTGPSQAVPRPPGVHQTGGTQAIPRPPGPAGQTGSGPTQGIPRPVGQSPSQATAAVPHAPGAVPSTLQTGPVQVGTRTQTGAVPTVTQPIPRPPTPTSAPSQQARPNPVAPGAAAQTGPVPVESMSGPFPRAPSDSSGRTTRIPTGQQTTRIPTSAQTSQIPKPQQTQQVRTTQALPKTGGAPLKPPPGMSEADVNALHAKYVKAKEAIGEKVDAGSREKLLRTINQTAPKVMEQYKASGVDFSVVVKDNQVVIKAKPKT